MKAFLSIAFLLISVLAMAQTNQSTISLFEPFKIENHKTLRNTLGETALTNLYHQYIKEKNINKDDDCRDYFGSCNYYLCREAKNNCGASGYNLGFGFQYCSESLSNLYPQMSTLGKKWLVTTATCLQKEMESISLGLSCREQKENAISGHDKCYSEISFCKLSISDITKIIKMIKPALSEKGVIFEGIQVLGHCLK